MSLKTQLMDDLKNAMKAGDSNKVGVLRMLNAALKNKSIDKKAKGLPEELADEDIMDALAKEAKKRRESIEAFVTGGRPELAEGEKAELAIIEAYLPKQMSETEIRAAIDSVFATLSDPKNLGAAMKAVMAELKGKADTQLASRIVREKIG